MEKFIKIWGNFEFQSSSGLTPEFKSFTTAMKKVFKEQALKNGCEILTSLARSPPHLSFLTRFTEAKVGDELLIGAGAALRAW